MGDAPDDRGAERDSPEQRLARIEGERDYYRRISELTGRRNLADVQELSRIINNLRQTEEVLRKTQDELELRVAERTSELIRVNADLRNEIRDRKKAEEALREREEMYRLLTETSPNAVTIAGPTGVVVMVNERALATYGHCDDEDVVGENIFRWVSEESREKALKAFEDVIRSGFVKDVELELIRKDSTRFWGSVNASLIRDPAGQPRLIIIVTTDITERKKIHEELLRAQKLESLSVLAGGVAHDFNNLMTGILGYTSLMLMEADARSPLYHRLKMVEQHVKSATALTNQLLGLARGGKYDVKPVGMNVLITKAVDMFGRTRKEIAIHCALQEGISSVEADPSQMEQVLLNLFINAGQAMPGGGSLFLETRDAEIDREEADILGLEQGRYVVISVADTGIGMDDATQQRIFDPFFTTKAAGEGTGLGLSSAYGIIKNHGGSIRVSSKPGKGTAFTIYLPASDKAIFTKEDVTGDIPKGTETILLVDDQEIVVNVSQEVLRELGYEVITALSGAEAIETFRRNKDRISLVILDMIMPGMNGGETYIRLKEIDPRVRVILSSGYSRDGQAQAILEDGCQGFLQKPFDIIDLAKAVRDALKI